MKKICLLLAFIIGLAAFSPDTGYVAKSQVTFVHTATNPTGAITNAGIDTATYGFTKGYPRVLFSLTYTRASGTGAGTTILEYRNSATDNYKSDAGDTLTVANAASQTLNWNKTVTARYWRVRTGGATTVTATVVVKATTN